MYAPSHIVTRFALIDLYLDSGIIIGQKLGLIETTGKQGGKIKPRLAYMHIPLV